MNLACAAPGHHCPAAAGPATCCCAIRCVTSGVSQPPSPLSPAAAGDGPLSAQEVWDMLQARWQVSYDLQLVQRRGRVYLQVMWAYLEQQSFPLSEEGYRAKLEELVGLLNGLGVAGQVRRWLLTTTDKPRLGKALGLALEMPAGRASEFLL
ncbi:DUF3067 family protein [Cyanobium sp. T1B-Tous]|nr:DUF3067 family protein [Cyanobium sp. T1B-Tous]